MPVIDTHALIEDRVHAIRAYHDSISVPRAELDVSGGIDSAVMLQLVTRALRPDRVVAVFTGIHSSQDARERAHAAARACDIPLVEVELTATFEQLQRTMLEALGAAGHDREAIDEHIAGDPTVLGSFRSCLRAPVGRGINRMMGGGIRHGTGNECEDRFLRFYQKGGDGEVDSNPIAMLSKGEVYQLARALDVPRSILEALPSPDLHGTGDAHNDEDELRDLYGVDWTYSRVDPDTGEYTFIGSIERTSRLLDLHGTEARLFGADNPSAAEFEELVETALRGPFHGFDRQEVHDLLSSARHIEAVTRHKWNPNCPTLGDRTAMLAAGILTDELMEV